MTPLILADFAERLVPWNPIDDPVMGGVSHSRFAVENGAGVFAGEVSLDRGGGFCSARSPRLSECVDGYATLRVLARGDGQRYQLGLAPAGGWNLTWRGHFRPGPEAAWVSVPLLDLVPMRRGSVVCAPPLEGEIEGLTVLIADKQAGPFRIELLRVELA